MIEVPAAAMSIRTLANYFDFFSIGSNDLIQYALAVDRCDTNVAHLYNPFHPGILFLISKIITDATDMGVPVSICGEIAGDSMFTRLLIGMGFQELSMHPANIFKIKEQILSIDTRSLAKHIAPILRETNPDQILESVKQLNQIVF